MRFLNKFDKKWGRIGDVFPEYEFPYIRYIDDIRPAYAGREEFVEQDGGDHITINYIVNFEDTFPHINKYTYGSTAALRRECRGIAFDKTDGLIIRRPPHKFFNLNERPETLRRNINELSTPFEFLEKLDGSCISAYKNRDGRIIWGTRAGETIYTPYVEAFVAANPQYVAVADYLIDLGWTPTFEFCSRKNRVVLDHPEDRLILTCARQIYSGVYLPYDQLAALREFGIEVVKKIDFKSIEECVDFALVAEYIEGWVVRFESGHMLKIKTKWYCDIHGCVTGIKFEKDVLNIILNDRLDDLKAFLPQDLIDRMEDYSKVLHNGFFATANKIASVVEAYRDRPKKDLAAAFSKDKLFSHIARAWDRGRDLNLGELVAFIYEDIRSYVRDRLYSQTWVDDLRFIYGNTEFIV